MQENNSNLNPPTEDFVKIVNSADIDKMIEKVLEKEFNDVTVVTDITQINKHLENGGFKKGDCVVICSGDNSKEKSKLDEIKEMNLPEDDWDIPQEESFGSDDDLNKFNFFKNNVFRCGNNRFHQSKQKTKQLKKLAKISKRKNRK